LDEDDDEVWESFPFFTWMPCDDGRSSVEHVALRTCGLGGTKHFKRDDPLFEPWWAARRKGEHPCRCTTAMIWKGTAARMNLQPFFIESPPFDPWSPEAMTKCMPLGGWDHKKRKKGRE
jgi:hypothetical protein